MRLAVGLVVLAALLRSIVWAVALPPWQGPDEPVHFSYIQRIATAGTIPAFDHSPPEYFSVATNVSVRATGYAAFRTRDPVRKLRRGLSAFPRERDDLSQVNHGSLLGVWNYPPGYYVLATPAYMLPFLHTDTERLYAVRFVSALIGAAAVLLVYLLFAEVGATPLICLLGALTYSLLPMVSQASAICNPDVLLMAAFAGLARSLIVLRRGWTRGSVVRAALWALIALLAKPIGGPGAAVMIVAMLSFGTGPRTVMRRAISVVAVTATLAVVYVAMAVATGWSLFGHAGALSATRYGASYLWQFYLPPLPFQDTARSAYVAFHSLPSWRVWVETGIGFFGWLTTPLPAWSYNLGFWALVAATCVAVWACIRQRGIWTRDRAVPALVAGAVANVLLLHLAEILLLLQGGSDLLLQGRYLLPVIPLFAAALYQPLSRVGKVGMVTTVALTLTAVVLSVQAMDSVLVFFG
jgi:hypothetical protein